MNNSPTIALADDHVMLRQGLAGLLGNLGYEILFTCSNGRQLIQKLDKKNLPDIVLMDINMPEMDGFEATRYVTQHFPSVSVLALSMYDDENAIIHMIKNGAKGYILKELEPMDLKVAIDNILNNGFHYSEAVTGKLVRSITDKNKVDKAGRQSSITARESQFLKLAASEMTYKEIASRMDVSPRTVDGYRETLFEKLNVKSRIGLVLLAIKQNLIVIN